MRAKREASTVAREIQQPPPAGEGASLEAPLEVEKTRVVYWIMTTTSVHSLHIDYSIRGKIADIAGLPQVVVYRIAQTTIHHSCIGRRYKDLYISWEHRVFTAL